MSGGRWLVVSAGALLLWGCEFPVVDPGPPDAGGGSDAGPAPIPECGDGVVEGDEECDPGPFTPSVVAALCHTDCRLARCGDGIVDVAEACDEGAANGGAGGCREDCSLATCGDGIVDPGEACDDGGPSPGCRADCSAPACGDGIVDPGEACDDGGPSPGCTADCRLPTADGTYRVTAELITRENNSGLDPPTHWGDLEGCLELELHGDPRPEAGGLVADFELLAFEARVTDLDGVVHSLIAQDDGTVEVTFPDGWEPTLGYLRLYDFGVPELNLLDLAVDGSLDSGASMGGPSFVSSSWSGTFPWAETVHAESMASLPSLGLFGEAHFDLERGTCTPP